MNRFTKDVDKIDTQLGPLVSNFSMEITLVILDVYFIILTSKQVLLLIPCATFFYVGIRYQRKYMKLKRELTRLQNITNSPVIGWCTSVLKSCTEVRVLGKQSYVRNLFCHLINENTKNSLIIYGLDGWFQTRISIMNLFLVQMPCYGYVFYVLYQGNQTLSISLLIMFILATTKLSQDMSDFLTQMSIFETSMVSVERCQAYERLPTEKGYLNYAPEEKAYVIPRRNAISDILDTKSQNIFPQGKV